MKLLSRNPSLPIGVDLGYDSIKLLQLERSAEALSIVAAASAMLCDSDRTSAASHTAKAIERLPALLKEHGFRGRRVVTCLPRELVQTKTLRLPVLPENELRSAIQFEATRLFQADADRLAIHFLTAGEVKQGNDTRTEVIVLAVEIAAIEAYLDQFNAVGLTVDALEYEPCAAYRGIERFMRRKEDDSIVNVLVDIGSRQSHVVIGRGHEVTFVKSIEIGGSTFTDLVARKLAVSTEEARELRQRYSCSIAEDPAKESVRCTINEATRHAMGELAREVSLCLRYYSVTFRGQRPAKVFLHGGEGNDATLRRALASFINIPIELRYPMRGIMAKNVVGGHCPNYRSEWGVAVGNALKRVTGAISPSNDVAYFGRREGDSSLVEVVDLDNAINASVPAEPAPRVERRRQEGAVHA